MSTTSLRPFWAQTWPFHCNSKGLFWQPPLHVLHSFIPRKTNNSGWNSKARSSNKQVPSNNFLPLCHPSTHILLLQKGEYLLVFVSRLSFKEFYAPCSIRMSLSHGGVFTSTAQYDLKLQGQVMALWDAIPKNPMEVFVDFCSWTNGT